MKVLTPILYIALFLMPSSGATFRKVEGIPDARIHRVETAPTNPNFIAVASDNTLFISRDAGTLFRAVMVLKDEQTSHLFIDTDPASTVYFSGSRTCYKIGTEVTRIFSARNGETIHFITKHDGILYVATSAGLYRTPETLLNWQTVPGLRTHSIYALEGFGNQIYLTSDHGAYHFQPANNSVRRLFNARENENGSGSKPLLIKADALTPARLWLCTSKGLFRSENRGETWHKDHIAGIDHLALSSFAQPQLVGNRLYVGSNRGLFQIDSESGTAKALYEGLFSSTIKWISLNANGKLYVATDQGLFENITNQSTSAPTLSLKEIMKGEPPIQHIQTAALRYNSVHPEKVNQWRKKLKYRALLPKLSVDYDKSISASSGRFYTGPRDWGISVSWDIGNLLWNTSENEIDNRRKQTTQQRMDILDEVNRLYFERLRLKQEIHKATNEEDITQQQLRLYELTATLDGYTGGFFSQNTDAMQL